VRSTPSFGSVLIVSRSFAEPCRKPDSGERIMKPRPDSPDADQVSDSTLHVLERAQGGDERAAHILIERALPGVRRWARGRLPRYARNDGDTEDVVQDVSLRTLRGIKRFQHRTVGGLQAVVNRIRDLIRRSRRRGPDVTVDTEPREWRPSPLEAAIMRQQLDHFLEALRKLRPADRQVIVWRIELGYTAEEIAIKLGKSKAAAGMTVSRAMARLAKELNLDEVDPRRTK
jgi:RNA polymerase sigma-70 factor (ECF subfamily)